MASDDDYYDDETAPPESGGEDGPAASAPARGPGLRDWITAKRGWLLIAGLAVIQAIFATIMIMMRANAVPVAEVSMAEVKELAVDMLGHEVAVKQIYQLIPARGGKRMTVGLDLVLVLGQLPEERIAGAPRPTPEEMELFASALRDMEPRIRNRVNMLLQGIPAAEYGTTEVYDTIKDAVARDVNDALENMNFGSGMRPGIGKRRVTEVLLPMFVRQYM